VLRDIPPRPRAAAAVLAARAGVLDRGDLGGPLVRSLLAIRTVLALGPVLTFGPV